MKRIISILAVSALLLCLPISVALAQRPINPDENPQDPPAPTDVETEGKLKQLSWDMDRLFDDALDQINDFVRDVPAAVNRVSIVRIDGDENVFVNTISLKYKLQDALIKNGRFRIVECRQCSNMKVYVEDESLILSRAVESNAEISKLGKELNIDAYIQGAVSINESVGKVQLSLMLIDVKDGTILSSTNLNSHYTGKDSTAIAAAKSAAPAKKVSKSSTDMEVDDLFPKLLSKIPDQLKGLPSNIKRVAISEFRGDDKYELDERLLKSQFERMLVNESGLTIVECPTCGAQQEFALRDAEVFTTSASTAKRIRNLSQQIGFDAYISSDIKILEDEQKIELNLKVVDTQDYKIVKAFKVRTLDDERILDKDSDHAWMIIPTNLVTLEGDANWNGAGFDSDKVDSFVGLGYQYATTTAFDNFLVGLDFGFSLANDIPSYFTSAFFFVKYRIPFTYKNYRLFDASFGMGTVGVHSDVGGCSGMDYQIEGMPIRLEFDSLLTPSLSAGLAYYGLGSHTLTFADCNSQTPTQYFNGNGIAIQFKYNF